MNQIAETTKGRIDQMALSLKQLQEEDKVGLEFVLMYLFPTVWTNIQEEMKRQYTLGYMEGQSENNPNKRSSR